MKKVFTDASQIAHLWANQLQDEATNAGHNFYFNRDTIYSYGSHFPIAKRIDNKVLMTLRTYSNTTAKHISMVRSAASHLDKIYCYDIPYNKTDKSAHDNNISRWLKNIESEAKQLLTARKPEIYVGNIKREINNLNEYVSYFKLKLTSSQKKIISIQDADGFKGLVRKQVEAKKAFEKAIVLKGGKLYLQSIAAWKNYNDDGFRKDLSIKQKELLSAYIRQTDLNTTYLRTDGKEIETSKQIKLPVDVAKRYYNWYMNIKTAGCNDCGYKILEYSVKQANETGLIVGCHNITIEEIKDLAVKLGW